MAANDAQRFPEAGYRLAGQLEDALDSLVSAMVERLLAEPDLRHYDEPHFRQLAAAIAHANLRHEIRSLRSHLTLPESCPPEAAQAARQAVDLDAPVTVVLQCYRAGHAVLWREWLRLVEGLADAAERKNLLETGSEFMFAYAERCSMFVIEEYNRYRQETDHTRLRAVQRVLSGSSDGGDDLGYRLGGSHLGLVAWGAEAERALREIAGALSSAALIVPGDDATVWAWCASPPARFRSALQAAGLPEGCGLSCGTVADGHEGFVRTHREAQDARAVGMRRSSALTVYADVALESLALVAEPRARDFVNLELGPLLDGSSRSDRLLDTLAAYFASLQNAAAAAARLGVNERTVRNRLVAVEELLGTRAADRRLELEAALRLRQLLGDV